MKNITLIFWIACLLLVVVVAWLDNKPHKIGKVLNKHCTYIVGIRG